MGPQLIFIEDSPLQAVPNGDHDELQVHDSWSRRFLAPFTGDQAYYAVIDLTYYQAHQSEGGALVLFREEEYTISTDREYPHDHEVWADVVYAETEPGDAEKPELARAACDQLTVADIRWPDRFAEKLAFFGHRYPLRQPAGLPVEPPPERNSTCPTNPAPRRSRCPVPTENW